MGKGEWVTVKNLPALYFLMLCSLCFVLRSWCLVLGVCALSFVLLLRLLPFTLSPLPFYPISPFRLSAVNSCAAVSPRSRRWRRSHQLLHTAN